MPAYVKPSCYLRVGGVDYKLRRGGLEITYAPNGAQMARCIVDLNDAGAPSPSIFAAETAVDVKIESITMMTGYIVQAQRVCEPLTQRSPGKKLGVELTIFDKVGYLTKGEFENDYFRLRPIQRLVQDVAGTMGVSHSISAALSGLFGQSFFGTMCKDALAVAVNNGADWAGDESGVLNAWPQASPPSLTTGGLTYQIQDFASGGSQQLEVSHLHKYMYDPGSALFRYRNVKVMNSNRETFPRNLDQICNEVFWNGRLGYNYARWISALEISGSPNKFRPAVLEPGPPMGGGTSNDLAPAVSFTTADVGDKLVATFWYIGGDDTAMLTSQYFKLPMNSYNELWFHLWTNINLADASQITISLLDNTTPSAAFYFRSIKADINASSQWTFLLYQLPTATSGASGLISNGWTKSGSGNFNQIDTVLISFVKASTGQNTGWPIGSMLKFSTFFFTRRVSAVASGPATGLNLTKPVVNDSIQDVSEMQNQANQELARAGYSSTASCICPGHTDFKRPGYMVNVNFNQTFGSGHSGSLRMEKIRHYVDAHGMYWMDLQFEPALRRL